MSAPLVPRHVIIDHAHPLAVQVIVRSDATGLFYKLWSRPSAAAPWVEAGDGLADDGVADRFDLGVLPPGASIAWWYTIGGAKGAPYRVDLALLQSGALVPGGLCSSSGVIGDGDLAIVESRVGFP